MELWKSVSSRLVTADAIYGLILYAALVGASSDEDAPDPVQVLVFSLGSLLIFWGAHVFAGTVANHGADVPLHSAMWASIGHASGMLYASILPSVPLVLGMLKLVAADDAVNFSLLTAMIILGLLGYTSFAQRKSHVVVCILGGIGTAFFGLLVILFNVAAH